MVSFEVGSGNFSHIIAATRQNIDTISLPGNFLMVDRKFEISRRDKYNHHLENYSAIVYKYVTNTDVNEEVLPMNVRIDK